jgi:hypothetical protein
VVQLLLDSDPNALGLATVETGKYEVDPAKYDGGTSPLILSCSRSDEEAATVATLLLQRGCDVNASSVRGETPLMRAAFYARAETVQVLLSAGADVSAMREDGRTAIHLACLNGAFGRDIILLLLGAQPTPSASVLIELFRVAVGTSGAMAETLATFLPMPFFPGVYLSNADPVGTAVWCKKYGAKLSRRGFALVAGQQELKQWTRLRSGKSLLLDKSEHDAMDALEQSTNVSLWKWASSEQQMQQHPVTGGTFFHLLCRSQALSLEEKLVVLEDLKVHHRNPLTPNYRNQLCVDLTTDVELKRALQTYMCWQPHRLVTEWFGPFFQRRAWALLLVCCRLKREHPKRLERLNRDVRHLLVRYVSKVEYIYVPSTMQQ